VPGSAVLVCATIRAKLGRLSLKQRNKRVHERDQAQIGKSPVGASPRRASVRPVQAERGPVDVHGGVTGHNVRQDAHNQKLVVTVPSLLTNRSWRTKLPSLHFGQIGGRGGPFSPPERVLRRARRMDPLGRAIVASSGTADIPKPSSRSPMPCSGRSTISSRPAGSITTSGRTITIHACYPNGLTLECYGSRTDWKILSCAYATIYVTTHGIRWHLMLRGLSGLPSINALDGCNGRCSRTPPWGFNGRLAQRDRPDASHGMSR
jgi:hypothetical protein